MFIASFIILDTKLPEVDMYCSVQVWEYCFALVKVLEANHQPKQTVLHHVLLEVWLVVVEVWLLKYKLMKLNQKFAKLLCPLELVILAFLELIKKCLLVYCVLHLNRSPLPSLAVIQDFACALFQSGLSRSSLSTCLRLSAQTAALAR